VECLVKKFRVSFRVKLCLTSFCVSGLLSDGCWVRDFWEVAQVIGGVEM
jgi:hypothetical protein